jgi:hypothetical protein
MTLAPLDNPTYTPLHPPIKGGAPEVVAKWGPRSQLRWFQRFAKELDQQYPDYWDRFYCNSLQHRGLHCSSCVDDENEGYSDLDPDHCCCRALIST